MNAYSIEVNNGKIIGDSTFFRIANDLLQKECKRLCDFTDALDKDPLQKKQKIAEYKCAKYRYAAVSLIHSIVQNNNRCRKLHNIEYSHYLLQPFDEIFREYDEYLTLYYNPYHKFELLFNNIKMDISIINSSYDDDLDEYINKLKEYDVFFERQNGKRKR